MTDMKPRIVAIDDEAEFTAMIQDYFELRGYEISVTNQGSKALDLIKEKKPDVLILDLKMPGINGDEVLVLAKRIQSNPKVIFVTAYDDGGATKARLLSEGAYACLDKPLSSIRLLEETVMKAYSDSSEKQN